MSSAKLVFAGGGTGGHVFPMIAVADAVRKLAPDTDIVFVGTERGLESKLVPARGYALELVNVKPMLGGGLVGAVGGALRAALATSEARGWLKQRAPHAIFSIGGYAAGPISLAARTLGIPVALMEPNTVIGLSNRLLARFVSRAYTAFPESERHFDPKRVLRAGVPIRDGFAARDYTPNLERPRLLVLGGSQGAKRLNEAVPSAIKQLGRAVTVVHQCGVEHEAGLRERYQELGLDSVAEVTAFIDDMPAALAAADLVIGRAGAGAVSEIRAIGRPSLLVPYPYAAGDHQRLNAESLVRDGAALCVLDREAEPERLALEISRLLADVRLLSELARAARERGRPDAARVIAEDLLGLANGRPEEAEGRARNGSAGILGVI